MPTEQDILKAARAAFEEAMRHYGVDPKGMHSWDRQTSDCQDSWRAVVKVVVRELAENKSHV